MNTNTNRYSAALAGETYTVVIDDLELPCGADFAVTPGPVEFGQLAMIEIGELQTVGRYYHNVAGADWIVQFQLRRNQLRQYAWGLLLASLPDRVTVT